MSDNKVPFNYFELEFDKECEANFDPYKPCTIEFEGETLYALDRLNVNETFRAKLELIHANDIEIPRIRICCEYNEGERLHFEGENEDYATLTITHNYLQKEGELYFKGYVPYKKQFVIYHVVEEQGYFWSCGQAMKKEICKDGSIIYRCNGIDKDNKKSFDTIIFKLTILEGEKDEE